MSLGTPAGVYYPLYELQRAALAPLLTVVRMPEAAESWQRLAFALGELAARSLEAGEPVTAPIEATVAADLGRPVSARIVTTTPFVRVVALSIGRTRRRILFVAPFSGYAAAAAVPLVLALLQAGEVWVTDWVDARLVPASAGDFRLDDQVALVRRLLEPDHRPAHLVGLSQSVPVVLAASSAGSQVASLVLLGGPADPTEGRSPLQQALALLPRTVLEQLAVGRVPARFPGAGRRAFPAALQLATYAALTPGSYLAVQGGLLVELASGRADGYARQHADLHRLLDVPAELFLDTIEHAVATPVTLGPASAPRRTVLLTVEAGSDSLVGAGQTHAAHRRLGLNGHRTTIDGAEHHDLFVGPRFAAEVAPVLARFYAGLAA